MIAFPKLLLLRTAFYFLSLALPMIFAPKTLGRIMDRIVRNIDLMRVLGFLVMLIGLLYLSVYARLDRTWGLVFSLLGYLSLIKGLFLLRYPEMGFKQFAWTYKKVLPCVIWGVICLLLAAFFVWVACTMI